jgi:hypothetical protein
MKIESSNTPPEGGIQITSRGGGEGAIGAKGFTPEELNYLEGALTHGSFWVRVKNEQEPGGEARRLVMHPVFAPFPDPVTDEAMLPFWRAHEPHREDGRLELFPVESLTEHASPSIYISSLCGYCYTPERYAEEAKKLERWGFYHMRSPRGSDGTFWETWFLPGLWSARGELQECIEGRAPAEPERRIIKAVFEDGPAPQQTAVPARPTNREKLDRALRFLQRNASFGSLSISVQKLAMVLD